MNKYTMSRYLDEDMLIKTMLNDLHEIYKKANNALYFDDNSDYSTALWEIMEIINPLLDGYDKLEYIE